MKLTTDMTKGNIHKVYLGFAFPLIFSLLLSQAYSTVDAVIAGKFIDENALGAISATGSYELLFNSLFSGFAAGFGIYTAQQFGKGDFASVKQDIVSMGIFVASIAAVISLLSIFLRDPIMNYLKVDPILRYDAEIYFVIYTAGYILSYLNLLMVQVLYALGITSVSLLVSFISAVVKIGGNLLSVAVLDFGIAGLGFFTVLSSAATTVCYLLILKKAFKELKSEKTPFRFRFACLKNSAKYTLPAAIQQAAFHGVGLIIAPCINGLGAAATTGYNVSNRIYSIGTISLWSVTNAFNCYTAQCVGKGDYMLIGRGIKTGFFLNCVMMLPFVFVLSFFARPIVSIFFPDSFTGYAYNYAVCYATIWLPLVYVQLVGHMLHSYMRSLGQVNIVLWITLLVSAVRVISTILLTPAMHIEGAYMGQAISWSIDAIISIAIVLYRYRTPEQLKAIVEFAHKSTQQKLFEQDI